MMAAELADRLSLMPDAVIQITEEIQKGRRFFVIARSCWIGRTPKQRLISAFIHYGSARKTFEGWRGEWPTLFYWSGPQDDAEDSLVIVDGPDYASRTRYLVAHLNLMGRGIIPSSQQQREELAEQIKRGTPCPECGMVGLHPITCSKRELSPEEKLKERVTSLESTLKGIATRLEEFHQQCEKAEYTDTGEFWELAAALHGVCKLALGPEAIKGEL